MENSSCIELEEQLFRNYNELYSLILQCYKDISMLDRYKGLQANRQELYNSTHNISNHIIRLIQKDLALTIWKIYIDNHRNANTIFRFRNSINTKMRNSGNDHMKIKKEKFYGDVTSRLERMRSQFLAHTDMTRNDSRMEIVELKGVLDVIRKEFNNVCRVINNERVKAISDAEVGLIDIEYQSELLTLYSQKKNIR